LIYCFAKPGASALGLAFLRFFDGKRENDKKMIKNDKKITGSFKKVLHFSKSVV
jgi:hypothetical protein